jgi:hypothetical protein
MRCAHLHVSNTAAAQLVKCLERERELPALMPYFKAWQGTEKEAWAKLLKTGNLFKQQQRARPAHLLAGKASAFAGSISTDGVTVCVHMGGAKRPSPPRTAAQKQDQEQQQHVHDLERAWRWLLKPHMEQQRPAGGYKVCELVFKLLNSADVLVRAADPGFTHWMSLVTADQGRHGCTNRQHHTAPPAAAAATPAAAATAPAADAPPAAATGACPQAAEQAAAQQHHQQQAAAPHTHAPAVRVSLQAHRDACGLNAYTRWRQHGERKQQLDSCSKRLSQLPPDSCSSVQAAYEHANACINAFLHADGTTPAAADVFSSKGERQWRFRRHMLQQRQTERVVQEMLFGGTAVNGRFNKQHAKVKRPKVVVFGVGNAGHGWQGITPWQHSAISRRGTPPTRKLIDYIRRCYPEVCLIVVDEFRTSKVCSRCGQLSLEAYEVGPDNAPHKLRACHGSCQQGGASGAAQQEQEEEQQKKKPLVLDRDINAARNIMMVLLAEMLRHAGVTVDADDEKRLTSVFTRQLPAKEATAAATTATAPTSTAPSAAAAAAAAAGPSSS